MIENRTVGHLENTLHADRESSSVGITLRSRQHLQSFLKAEGLEGFPTFAVVVGIVGVEPIALRVDGEIGDLGQLRSLDQELLLGKSPAIKAVSVSFK